MPNYAYLIIGGGMTAAAAIAGIREVDRQGAIGLIAPSRTRPTIARLFPNHFGRVSCLKASGERQMARA